MPREDLHAVHYRRLSTLNAINLITISRFKHPSVLSAFHLGTWSAAVIAYHYLILPSCMFVRPNSDNAVCNNILNRGPDVPYSVEMPCVLLLHKMAWL